MVKKLTEALKIIKLEIMQWFEFIFIKNFPGRTGVCVRRLYYLQRLRKASSFSLYEGCAIWGPQNISLGSDAIILHNCNLYAIDGIITMGNRVGINSNVLIDADNGGEISIGNDVSIGPNVVVRASNHTYARTDIPINQQGHIGGRIVIEDDVWIGANAVILPDTKIAKGTVVAAGAVVTKDTQPYSVVAGVPAKVIKKRGII